MEFDAPVEELIEAAEMLLRGGAHEMPCANYAGQDPDGYTEYDSCWRHIETARDRKQRVRAAINALRVRSSSGE